MSLFSRVKENLWVGAGGAAGLTLGMGANLFRTGSLFGKSFTACKEVFFANSTLATVNSLRQKVNSSTNLFNPICPMIHTIPMFWISVWNTMNPRFAEANTDLASRGWKNLSKLVIKPLVYQNLLLGASSVARNLFSSPTVNPSIPVIFQAAQTYYAMKSLEGLDDSPVPKKVYTTLNLGLGLLDAIRLYHNAANCYTVADTVAGAASVALGFIGLEAGRVILNKGSDLIKAHLIPAEEPENEEIFIV